MFKLKRAGFHEVETNAVLVAKKKKNGKKKKKEKFEASSSIDLRDKIQFVIYEALARVTEARVAGAISKIGADESRAAISLEVCSDICEELRHEVYVDEEDDIVINCITVNASSVLFPSIEDAVSPLLDKLLEARKSC